jgi:GTP-binding protein
MIDAREGLTEHDASLAGLALKEGRGIVIAINKWDDLTYEHKQNIRASIERRLRFICDFARIHFISALHGTNVGHLFESINEAYESAFCNMPTNELTRLLKLAVNESPPPLSGRLRIKPKYAHSGGKNPPLIVIHGNQVQKLSHAYQRYLINYFRQAYHLMGTPVSLELRETANPYENQQKNKKKS